MPSVSWVADTGGNAMPANRFEQPGLAELAREGGERRFPENARNVDRKVELFRRRFIWRHGARSGDRGLGREQVDLSRSGADFCPPRVYRCWIRHGRNANPQRLHEFERVDDRLDGRVSLRSGSGHGKLLGADPDTDAWSGARGHPKHCRESGGHRSPKADRLYDQADGQYGYPGQSMAPA